MENNISVEIKIGQTISFRYKGGRKVNGKVISVQPKNINLLLNTDYIGKNVEWFIGEEKIFILSEMEKVKIIQPVNTKHP